MGTVIQFAASRIAAVAVEPVVGITGSAVTGVAGAGLGETIAQMRTSLQLAANALRTVATEARASAAAYRTQAADIRRQIADMDTAVRSLKDGTASISRIAAAQG